MGLRNNFKIYILVKKFTYQRYFNYKISLISYITFLAPQNICEAYENRLLPTPNKTIPVLKNHHG